MKIGDESAGMLVSSGVQANVSIPFKWPDSWIDWPYFLNANDTLPGSYPPGQTLKYLLLTHIQNFRVELKHLL